MKKIVFIFILIAFSVKAHGTLAGGRPNAFSEGQNSFAGVVNPANAIWIKDRFDVGVFWFYQKSSLNNRDNNPLFVPGKMDFTYKTKNRFTADAAIQKKITPDFSIGLAYSSVPSYTSLRTKTPIPISGTTPVVIFNNIETLSAIFSHKINECHSIGISGEYYYFSHKRNGYQNSDNPRRSVSPGHVTNNGMDHSHGFGLTLGWRWNITKSLNFGAAYAKKSPCGQYRKYRGFEPHHAKNYIPQTFGAGFRYLFSPKIAGRLEVLWTNLGNLPGANNNVLPDGRLNQNKRGSRKSPGPGLQDATYINIGLGYKWNEILSFGTGFSHRIKLHKGSNFISHTYTFQTIYDILSFGANINYKCHDLFMSASYGFRNRVSGNMPVVIGGGGKFTAEKTTASLSFSWGYLY